MIAYYKHCDSDHHSRVLKHCDPEGFLAIKTFSVAQSTDVLTLDRPALFSASRHFCIMSRTSFDRSLTVSSASSSEDTTQTRAELWLISRSSHPKDDCIRLVSWQRDVSVHCVSSHDTLTLMSLHRVRFQSRFRSWTHDTGDQR